MAYSGRSRETKEDAYYLYCEGFTFPEIAEMLGVGKASVFRWKTRFNWEERKRKYQKEVTRKNMSKDEVLIDKIDTAMLHKTADMLQRGEFKLTQAGYNELAKRKKASIGVVTEKIEHSGEVNSGKYELVVNFPEGFEMPKKKSDIK